MIQPMKASAAGPFGHFTRFALLTRCALVISALSHPSWFPGTAFAEAPAPTSIEPRVLVNGLQVLLLPEQGRDIASVQLWYRVGLPEEDAETLGFAHLLEHLMFTGTAAHPDFRGAVASLGGQTSSGPREDLTYFIDDVPSSSVPAVLALEADRMRDLALAPAAIEKSMAEVQREEAELAARGGQAALVRAVEAAAFAGHPYANSSRVPAASSANPERCRTFYERFFGPDRACLVVAGGFDADSVATAIDVHFGALAARGNPRSALPAPPDPGERRKTIEVSGISGPWIAIAYRAPGAGSPDVDALKLIESYLNVEAADSLSAGLLPPGERIPVAATAAHLNELIGVELLTILAPLPPGGNADHAIDRLAGMIGRTAGSVMDPANFAILRDRVRLAQAASLNTVRERASALALAYLRDGTARTVAGTDSALAALEPSQFSRAAASTLNPDQAIGLKIQPAAKRSD